MHSVVLKLNYCFLIECGTCEAKNEGLVRYPARLVPARGSVSVLTECADNAHRTSDSMTVRCASDGTWSSHTPQCACDSGYHAVNNTGRHICQTNGIILC